MKDSYRVEPAATVEEQPLSKDLAIGKDTPGKPFFILLSLFSLYIIWGGTYLAMRIGLNGFPPFLLASARFLIAGIILYTVLHLRGAAAPTRAQWIGSAIIGILLLAGGNGGVVFSEQWVASGLAAVGIAAVPLWTALFAGLWGRWPTGIEWLGLGVGFIGVLLVISLGLRERAPNLAVGQSLWALAYLIIFGSLVAFSSYGYLLRHVRPALATSYAYVNPMVAVGLGVLLAGERLTPIELVAIAVTLSGVVLVSLVSVPSSGS